MAVSPAYRLICFLGAALVVLPHLNLGMMSDYKICGDSACESMLSRAQALRDYHGKDCRFLSFRKGNTIIVYHKLTGKRDDLWAGSIDRQFGYFPKDAVQEEQVYAAIQKVVETRKSDFFCMDEFGYPTDSSHLDSDDDDESDEENQVQESETTKTSAGNPNSNALTSGDPLTESTVPVQEVEQDEKKNDGDAAEDSNENPAVLNEQGGSPSTAWLSSSMTGWLGLAAEEQADHSVDGKKQDEKKEEIQAENLLASSVTGWFQLGGEGNVDTAEENVISREENAESATSTMSGWLGFGSKKQTDSENEEKEEPVEKFRSRRFSLDLEGSQLHEEEKEDTGTLGWLRNGLSNTLGFNPESGQETSEEKVEKDKEEPAAGSWFEIGGILGFKKDNNEVKTEKAASRSEETENEQERTSSNNADAITLQPALRADEKIESTSASQREEPPMGQTGYLPIKIGEKEYKDEEDEDHLKPKLITDDRKDFVESNQDEIQIPTGTDYDISGQSDIDNSSEEVNSNVTGAYLAKAQEEDEKDSLSVETEADVEYHEDLRSHEDSGLLGRENVSTQGEKSEVESQLISASDSYEKNEPIQDENATFTSQDTETVLVIDDKAEKERSHSEFVQEQETSVGGSLEEFKLAQFTGGGTESLHENALREDEAGASSGGSVQNTKSVVDSEAGSEGGVERNDGGKEELFGVEENKLEDSKQVKEGQEEGEQEEVGQLVDEEEDKNLKDFKEEERYKEVDELEDREKQDDLNEVKEEGVLVEIKPEEKQEDDQKVKEEEEKIVKESEDQNKEGQVDKPNGEKKNEDMVEQKEGVTGETMEEVKEKKQKEEEELEGPNEPMQEEGNGGLHFSHLDDQINKIGEDSSRTESEINKENMQENSLSFVEPSTETGNSLLEEEKWNEKKEKQEVLAELYGTMVQTEERQGEDENLECSNGLCTEGCGKALVVAGDKGSTEVGESLASEGMKGEQNNHTNGAQERKPIQYDDTVEREKELEIVDFDNTEGNDLWRKEGQELSASASDPEENVSHGSVASPDDQSKETAESESTGTFGGFKHVFGFGFFSQPSTSDTQKSTQPAQISDLSLDNSEEQDYSAPGVDSYTDSSKNQDEPPESPTEETQSYSPPADTSVNTPSPNLEAPLQTKDLSKHYKILLSYLNAEEITILLDLFGQHKLQFLDYVLSSSEAEDPTGHQSIVSDIERLLQHHTEKLVAPSIRLNGAPQEDKYKTRTLIVLQKLEMLLETVKKSFNAGQSDPTSISLCQSAETSCLGLYCSTSIKDQEMYTEEQATKKEDPSGAVENNMNKEELIVIESDTAGINRQILDFVHQMTKEFITTSKESRNLIVWLTNQVVSALPDDIRPGPDLYGMPWEPIIITGVVGLVTILLFMCRCYSSVKSRMYRSKERGMAEQVTQLLDEKCKVLETLSQCQQEYDELEDSLKDSGVLAQHQKTEELEGKAKHLAHAKRELERDLENLKDHLNQQREQRTEQERRISVLEVSLKTCEEEITDLQSQDEQAQTTVKVYNMNSDRLERNLETAKEENTVLQESNAQLKQQVEGWAERVSELEGEMRRCEVAHSGMLQDVTNKDERIMSLTDRLLRMKGWDSDLEEEDGEKEATNGTAGNGKANESVKVTDPQVHLQKVQKLINAAKLNADLKSVDEDKDRVFARLSDEVKAKEDLQAAMKELESEKSSLQSDAEHYSDQVQRLQQKLHIMTEMYQENELKLHRLLTVEEKERSQKEQKLNKADKNIAMAMEELNNYRQRAGEMEDELEKTKQSYQTQISAHEKKAHNNWLAARAADRELADIRRENGLLRQKLTDTQFKLDALDKDPYALDSLARPLPFRGERSPYGPSPLGRPGSETRAFLSPPTLMEGPPARLSPRVPRGPGEPPSGQGEMERSGGPHSDSGSISPTWDRDRRGPPPGHPGPLGPPGYMFPEPGGPMYRRAPPHPGAMGHMPPPGPLPPGGFPIRGFPPGPPHPLDMADGPYRENSLGATEQEHRESGLGERKTPPESEQRMGGPPLPSGPPIGPMDGPFPRRPPYGPPPPDFYPPRGPGAPPMMPMWAPRALPPPGMMLPPRFPPHPHVPPYGAPMRPPHPSDGLPPPSMGPPLHQQSLPPQQDNTPSPEDAI